MQTTLATSAKIAIGAGALLALGAHAAVAQNRPSAEQAVSYTHLRAHET